jgi:hypothetical protein
MPPIEVPEVHHYTAVITIHARDMVKKDTGIGLPRSGTSETVMGEAREVSRIVVRDSSVEGLVKKVQAHLDLVEDI